MDNEKIKLIDTNAGLAMHALISTPQSVNIASTLARSKGKELTVIISEMAYAQAIDMLACRTRILKEQTGGEK